MAQASNRRNASIAVTILLFIACASLFGGWSTTNFKKSKKRPVSTRPAGLASEAAKMSSVTAPRGTSASSLDIVAEISAEEEARLPRFRRDRYWANETPAVTIPFSSAHGAEDVTTVECVGGANPQTHTCRIYNACFDAELDNHGAQPAGHSRGGHLPPPPRRRPAGSYEDSLVIFTGDTPVSEFTLGLADGSRVPFKGNGEFLLWHGESGLRRPGKLRLVGEKLPLS